MDLSQIDYSQIIITTLNKLFTNLFSSIDTTFYSILDRLAFVDTSIFDDKFFQKIFGINNIGIITIANALILGFVLFYCFRLLFSTYFNNPVETPRQFIFKLLIITILINFSPFICEKIIYINSILTDSIKSIGHYILDIDIGFSSLISQLNSHIYTSSNTFNLFSFDGIVKSFISIGLLTLLMSYSLRYILIKIFILLSPFAILSLINQSSSWFFKSWIRNFISLLLIQSFISIILLLFFSIDKSTSTSFSQLMYIAAIFVLSKANNYMRELIGGISTDFNINFSNIRSLLK